LGGPVLVVGVREDRWLRHPRKKFRHRQQPSQPLFIRVY
jgi:hypothetical protein